jgi:hypothetical protein
MAVFDTSVRAEHFQVSDLASVNVAAWTTFRKLVQMKSVKCDISGKSLKLTKVGALK